MLISLVQFLLIFICIRKRKLVFTSSFQSCFLFLSLFSFFPLLFFFLSFSFFLSSFNLKKKKDLYIDEFSFFQVQSILCGMTTAQNAPENASVSDLWNFDGLQYKRHNWSEFKALSKRLLFARPPPPLSPLPPSPSPSPSSPALWGFLIVCIVKERCYSVQRISYLG